MDTTPNAVHTLTRGLRVTLRYGDLCATSIPAELSYVSSDPYAITLSFRRHQPAVPWVFARDLLSRGLTTPTGDGDVHIWPDHDDDGHAIVTIELCSPAGHALIDVPTADALDFITHAHTIVASGHESRHVDLDATISAIRATARD